MDQNEHKDCPYYRAFSSLEITPRNIVDMDKRLKVIETKTNFNLFTQLASLLGLGMLILKSFF